MQVSCNHRLTRAQRAFSCSQPSFRRNHLRLHFRSVALDFALNTLSNRLKMHLFSSVLCAALCEVLEMRNIKCLRTYTHTCTNSISVHKVQTLNTAKHNQVVQSEIYVRFVMDSHTSQREFSSHNNRTTNNQPTPRFDYTPSDFLPTRTSRDVPKRTVGILAKTRRTKDISKAGIKRSGFQIPR